MRARRTRRGGNAIEFGLLFPLLFALMTGIMDLGYLEMVRFVADSAAREGARIGSMTGDNALASDAALTEWEGFSLPTDAPTIVAYQTGDPLVEVVRVQVDLTMLVGFVLGPQTVEVVATRRVES
ncbi:MAG: pilus assembly protein [Myxococcales bacterium]|nr:pilus assembly protein [Myxococcales bacterium]